MHALLHVLAEVQGLCIFGQGVGTPALPGKLAGLTARHVLVPRRCVRQSCRTYVEEAQQCQQAAQLRLLAGGQDARARPVARKARINRAQITSTTAPCNQVR